MKSMKGARFELLISAVSRGVHQGLIRHRSLARVQLNMCAGEQTKLGTDLRNLHPKKRQSLSLWSLRRGVCVLLACVCGLIFFRQIRFRGYKQHGGTRATSFQR